MSDPQTIEQIILKKQILQAAIYKLISDFQKETKMIVTAIHLDSEPVFNYASAFPVDVDITKFDIKIEIPNKF